MSLPQWYVQVVRLTREINKKARDACKTKNKTTISAIKGYLQNDFERLKEIWPSGLQCPNLNDLGRHIYFGAPVDYDDILEHDLPDVEKMAEKYFLENSKSKSDSGFESLLHPVILDSSYQQFQEGHFRDAVLNAIIGLLDHIRKITGLKKDGAKLVNDVFGGDNPILVFSEIETESGKNDQGGFHKIFLGTCEGIRNPKAHSLVSDLTRIKAAQYLVFASLLARRVDECKK